MHYSQSCKIVIKTWNYETLTMTRNQLLLFLMFLNHVRFKNWLSISVTQNFNTWIKTRQVTEDRTIWKEIFSQEVITCQLVQSIKRLKLNSLYTNSTRTDKRYIYGQEKGSRCELPLFLIRADLGWTPSWTHLDLIRDQRKETHVSEGIVIISDFNTKVATGRLWSLDNLSITDS